MTLVTRPSTSRAARGAKDRGPIASTDTAAMRGQVYPDLRQQPDEVLRPVELSGEVFSDTGHRLGVGEFAVDGRVGQQRAMVPTATIRPRR